MHLLILGGSSPMAVHLAGLFATHHQAEITLASRNQEQLSKNAAYLNATCGSPVHTAYFDACDRASHEGFYRSLSTAPDGVIIAVGYYGNQNAAQSDPKEQLNILTTNFIGPISILEIIAADFQRRKTGFIIGIGSVSGVKGRKRNYIYGSAKAGFHTYLSGLRHRLSAEDIPVMTVIAGPLSHKSHTDPVRRYLALTPEAAGDRIFKAWRTKKDVIFVPGFWRVVMTAIQSIPERLFKRMGL
ncbi:MAG: short-chain dehydrogenase [Deltaproteobacteria bacterium]|nr:MAG: short-chain dehydrogenase [Deltaproteobacteria bacterium]